MNHENKIGPGDYFINKSRDIVVVRTTYIEGHPHIKESNGVPLVSFFNFDTCELIVMSEDDFKKEYITIKTAYSKSTIFPEFKTNAEIVKDHIKNEKQKNKTTYGKKIKVYLCGPISGMPDNNKPLFDKYDKMLTEAGYDVVNPHTISPFCESKEWSCYMKDCIRELTSCKYLIRLPDWEKSPGAKVEIQLANTVNIVVCDIDWFVTLCNIKTPIETPKSDNEILAEFIGIPQRI